ncbi:ammonium transporter [Alkanindiges sp. WGS2144]|uniref:ammonium transporter n=1 Tax=Alkanindiges sp. WGS2144 TaxID=3366808 RepID=UPI003750E384
MSTTAYWVIGFIIIFILGSILGLRVSPREKALGQMRDRARKMNLHPRLIAAPDWIEHISPSGKPGGMVAFYSVLLSDARLPLMQALVEQQKLRVRQGNTQFDGQVIDLKGIYALEMQANCVGMYWDEDSDLHGSHLEKMKTILMSLAQQAANLKT